MQIEKCFDNVFVITREAILSLKYKYIILYKFTIYKFVNLIFFIITLYNICIKK